MKVLLTGGSGQLGRCIQDRCPAHWQITAPGRAELDMGSEQAIQEWVHRTRPDLIINAAAYTAVDLAESQKDQAFAINADGPAYLAAAAAQADARFIHVSTDYVFDGNAGSAYTEEDPTTPINVYGQSKRQGELTVLKAMPKAVILRVSWLYSEYGSNFVKTMLRLAQSAPPRPSLNVVDDQHGCPTYAGDLADVIIALNQAANSAAGIYHYCGATAMSWYEFAEHIFACATEVQPGFQSPTLQAIPGRNYASAAARPANSVLNCEKIRALGIQPRPLHASLLPVVRALLTT